MTKDMTKGSPMTLILSFAVPMLLGMLFQQFYNLVDTMIVGKTLGVDALAGVGATGCMNFMIVGFCMGVCSGFAIPVAQNFGAGNYAALRKYVFNGYWCAGAFAAVITTLSVVFCRQILQWLKTPEDIFLYSYHYIVVIFMGIPIIFLYNMVSGIIRSMGDSRTPVYFLVFSAVVNIALDFVFILVCDLGVAGAALATNVSQLLAGIGCCIYMIKRFTILKSTKEERRVSYIHIRRLCINGVPMGLQYSITAIGSVLLQAAVNGLGATYVAASTAAGKLFNFTCCPFDALGATMATYSGQNVGAGQLKRLNKGIRAASFVGAVYSILAIIALYFGAKWTLLLFLDAKEVTIIGLSYRFILIGAAFYIPLALVNIVRFSIQGMGFSSFAILAGVLEMAARSFAAIVLIPLFGYYGACFAGPLAWVAADCFLIPAFLGCVRKLEKKRKGKKNGPDIVMV